MIAAQVGIFLNSIDMMEAGRCGRRKQRNPKRKNVENGLDGEESEDIALDDNKNQIVSQHSPGSSYHSDGDDITDLPSDGNHGNTDNTPSTTTVEKKEPTPEEKVSAILREIQCAAPDSTSDERISQSSHPNHRHHVAKTTEDAAKIAEFLNRGDTAVIYPEPVSDGEETHNDEGALSDEEIVLKCIHCPQTFLRAIILRDHMRDQHADKPLKFMCPKCDETFHQKSQLDKHLTLHSPTSQVCSVCHKTFANVYRLQRHMISHNESTDLRKFKCPECGKAFKFKHHLKEHIRIHSGEKPFVCNNCGKRFSHSGSFSSHTTSKKCWGMSAHKNRVGADSTQNLAHQAVSQSMTQSFGTKIPTTFANSKLPQFQRSPLQSVPVTLAAHQQHYMSSPYTQQKGVPQFYYPPAMFTSPDQFLHPVYSVPQAMSAHLPHGICLPTLPGLKPHNSSDSAKDRASNSPHPSVSSMSSAVSRSTRSVSPHSQSTRSFSPHSQSGRSISPYSSSAFSLSSPPSCHSQSRRSTTPGSSSVSYRDVTPVSCRDISPMSCRDVTPAKEHAPSTSPHSVADQISPDVNSNTKLMSIKEDLTQSNQKDKTNEGETESENIETNIDTSIANKVVKIEAADTVNDTEDNQKVTQSDSDKGTKRTISCHHCKEVFDSPVSHHQHERYMCKHNKDVVQNRVEPSQSPHSTVSDLSHLGSTPNGSVGNDSDEEDVEELYKDYDVHYDEKKMRIRSLFTEEQQNFLKSQYLLNPRPRKFELIRMGNRIGFPKRVVQVWFQNMRARERKHGRELNYHSAPIIKSEGVERIEKAKSPTYIPNVPKPFPNLYNMRMNSPLHTPSPQLNYRVSAVEHPLDLTVNRTPPLAHGGSMSRHSTPDSSNDDEVLNLSVKKEKSVDREGSEEKQKNSDDKETSDKTSEDSFSSTNQKRIQESAIFKYMQQEGMILNKRHPHLTGTMSPSLAHSFHTQLLHQSMASVLKMPNYPINTNIDLSRVNTTTNSVLFDPKEKSVKTNDSYSCSRLIIDEAIKEANSHARDSTPPYSTMAMTPMTSDPVTMVSNHTLADRTHDLVTLADTHNLATHNLATLAEAAQRAAANILCGGKPKRMRKKTWRQVDCYVESEQVQLDLEDSGSTDDDSDQPQKKKRKSWKNHRVDRDEGQYACDQCNKMFSKQSSLARHKYEHSGARPFACDMCTKSFKHKHHLTEHKRLHSGEKPFQCKKCGKRFSHSGSFSQHMNHRYNYCSPHKTSDGDGDGDVDGDLSSQESP